MDRVILHSDMNNCYASIELLHHPDLRGRPLAVGGDPEARHGIVLAKDQLAKKAGVKTGMALWQAREVCPEIQFVPPHMDLYLRICGFPGWHMKSTENIQISRRPLGWMKAGWM